MASNLNPLSKANKLPNGSAFRIGIVVSSYYYKEINQYLLEACRQTLLEQQVKADNITIVQAPGTYELPLACSWLNQSKTLDAIIALACVIRGETDHDKYINHAVADGLQQLSVKENKPFIFGVLTPNNFQQAKDRAGGKHGNKGVEAASACLQMLALKQELNKHKPSLGFK